VPRQTDWLGVVASSEECEAALNHLAARFTEVDEEVRRRHASDRTISCRIPDLGVTYSGQLRDGMIEDIDTGEGNRAHIRLTVASDDLVALTAGQLRLTTAWATGKLRVEASIRDLWKLRSLL
jgi:putative sterol carrier protein